MNATSDAIVIGAGIVGISCALRLAQRGLSVRLIEREIAPATGSTGRSAAGVRHQFSEAVNVQLSRDSIAEYRAMSQSGYRPIGYLFLVPESDWPAQLDAIAMQRAMGLTVEALTPQEAARILPSNLNGIAGASWCADDGIVDPHSICMAWLSQARALGVKLQTSSEVCAIEQTPGGWQIQCQDSRDRSAQLHQAPILVNAAGAWAGQVAALAGLNVPVGPARRMIFVTGPLPESLRRAHWYPLTVDMTTGFWLRSEHERLIFGLSNPQDSGFSQGIDWEWLEPTCEAALERFPWFEQLSIDRRASWWGYYEDTPDHNPILGAMPGMSGWINACGFSGHGVQQAAATGRLIAQEALGERTSIDLSTLRIERFSGQTDPGKASERLIV